MNASTAISSLQLALWRFQNVELNGKISDLPPTRKENYQHLKEVWGEKGFKRLKYLLKYYNKCNVVPMDKDVPVAWGTFYTGPYMNKLSLKHISHLAWDQWGYVTKVNKNGSIYPVSTLNEFRLDMHQAFIVHGHYMCNNPGRDWIQTFSLTYRVVIPSFIVCEPRH